MRLFLAVGLVAGLSGFGFADDDKKAAKKATGAEKPAVKAIKVAGEIKAIDGNKVTVATAAPADGAKKKPAATVEYTVDDKTRIQVETGKDAEVKTAKGKPQTMPERTDAKVADLKVGAKVSGLATAEKVLLQVIQLRPAKKDGEK